MNPFVRVFLKNPYFHITELLKMRLTVLSLPRYKNIGAMVQLTITGQYPLGQICIILHLF